MAQLRITCTRQEPVNEPATKAHIVAVGTGSRANHYDALWSIEEVLDAMDHGHQFYTRGEHSGLIAIVEKFVCPSCRKTFIRSAPDAISDNNLDNLPRCA